MWHAARWRQGRQHDKGGWVAGDLGLQFPHQQRMQGPTLQQHRRLRPHVINVYVHVINVCAHVTNVCAHVITVCVLRLSAAALTLCWSRSCVSRWRRRDWQQSGWRSSRDVWLGICSVTTKRIDRDSVSGKSVCLVSQCVWWVSVSTWWVVVSALSQCVWWVRVSRESECRWVSVSEWWVSVSAQWVIVSPESTCRFSVFFGESTCGWISVSELWVNVFAW